MNRIIDVSKARIPSVKVPIDNGGGTANVGDVLAAKTFDSESGLLQVGTIPNIAGNQVATSIDVATAGRLYLRPPIGYYSGWFTYADDANWLAANIPLNMSMFGLVGTGVNAKRKATGSGTSSGAGVFSVSGLSFTPNQIYINIGDLKLITFLTGSTNLNKFLYDSSTISHLLTTNWAVSAGAFSCADTANANTAFTYSAYE